MTFLCEAGLQKQLLRLSSRAEWGRRCVFPPERVKPVRVFRYAKRRIFLPPKRAGYIKKKKSRLAALTFFVQI